MELLDAFECGEGSGGCNLCKYDIVGFGVGKKKVEDE